MACNPSTLARRLRTEVKRLPEWRRVNLEYGAAMDAGDDEAADEAYDTLCQIAEEHYEAAVSQLPEELQGPVFDALVELQA